MPASRRMLREHLASHRSYQVNMSLQTRASVRKGPACPGQVVAGTAAPESAEPRSGGLAYVAGIYPPVCNGPKNNARDPEGIAEAGPRPAPSFVDLKSHEQLDIQTLYQMRSRDEAERTNQINQLCAIISERWPIFSAMVRQPELRLDGMLAKAVDVVSPRVHQLAELRTKGKVLDTELEASTTGFNRLPRENAAMRKLTSIPAIGGLYATALVATAKRTYLQGYGSRRQRPHPTSRRDARDKRRKLQAERDNQLQQGKRNPTSATSQLLQSDINTS